jgi:tetratricopeptide (TPR) repeat protein
VDAIVSAVAARIIFVEGTEVSFVDVDRPTVRHAATHAQIPHLMDGAYDSEVLLRTDEASAFDVLLKKWNRDRALRMLQIVLDSDEERDIRQEAAECLDSQLKDSETARSVENFCLAIPLSKGLNVDSLLSLFRVHQRTVALVRLIAESHDRIAIVHEGWKSVSPDLFSSESDRCAFELSAIELGAFRGLVVANSGSMANAIFACYSLLSGHSNCRQIVMAWTKNLGSVPRQRAVERSIAISRERKPTLGEAETPAKMTPYQLYQNALKQQEGIIQRLRDGDVTRARRYTSDLVDFQIEKSGRKFAAKSLCLLSHEAKENGLESLQLEWVRQAVEIAPNDAWAHGQAGDAFLDLWRLDEARAEYLAASGFGEPIYGEVGLARILRASGRFEEALLAFEAIIQKFGTEQDNARAWSGRAEVLRDLSRFEAALDAYDSAISKYPHNRGILCGRAATLSDLGRLEAAFEAYSAVISEFPEADVAYAGRANTLKEMGRVEEAHSAYADARSRFPRNVILLCGSAEVFRTKGDFAEAVKIFEDARSTFPHSIEAFCGYAEAIKDVGRLDESLAAYNEAIGKFPFNAKARNGRANILRLLGRFDEALKEYEANVRDFPYDLFALSGRADLLRVLGHPELALAAYDAIVERRPDHPGAVTAKAAVLILLRRFSEAEALLPPVEPQSRAEWMALHVRGMMFLKKGEIHRAHEIFLRGAREAPFFRQRKRFESAVAASSIRLNSVAAQAGLLDDPIDDVGRLLKVHICSILKDFDCAKRFFAAVNDNLPQPLHELRREIQSRFIDASRSPAHDERWLEDRETEVMLQAA